MPQVQPPSRLGSFFGSLLLFGLAAIMLGASYYLVGDLGTLWLKQGVANWPSVEAKVVDFGPVTVTRKLKHTSTTTTSYFGRVKYEYVINNQTHTGVVATPNKQDVSEVWADLDEWATEKGQPIRVYYSADYPHISSVDPNAPPLFDFIGWLVFLLFTAALGLGFGVLGLLAITNCFATE